MKRKKNNNLYNVVVTILRRKTYDNVKDNINNNRAIVSALCIPVTDPIDSWYLWLIPPTPTPAAGKTCNRVWLAHNTWHVHVSFRTTIVLIAAGVLDRRIRRYTRSKTAGKSNTGPERNRHVPVVHGRHWNAIVSSSEAISCLFGTPVGSDLYVIIGPLDPSVTQTSHVKKNLTTDRRTFRQNRFKAEP